MTSISADKTKDILAKLKAKEVKIKLTPTNTPKAKPPTQSEPQITISKYKPPTPSSEDKKTLSSIENIQKQFSGNITDALSIDNSKSKTFDYTKVEEDITSMLHKIEKEKMQYKNNYKKHLSQNLNAREESAKKQAREDYLSSKDGRNNLRLERLESKFGVLVDRLEKSASPSTAKYM